MAETSSPLSPQRKISFVVVNWNSGPWLKRCLSALPASAREGEKEEAWEAVVVDNASQDRSAEEAAAEAEKLKIPFQLLVSSYNRGFAGAINWALRRAADGDVIIALNPDVVLFPGAAAKLARLLREDNRVGIAGPQLRDTQGRIQPSCRRFPSAAALLALWFKLPHFYGETAAVRRYLMRDFAHDRLREVDQIMGAALAFSRRLLEEIGFWDEGYHLWFEEVDFCWRARQAGWKVIFYPAARAVHAGGVSFGQRAWGWRQWRFWRSALRYWWRCERKGKRGRLVARGEEGKT
jgi:hypothetical protein